MPGAVVAQRHLLGLVVMCDRPLGSALMSRTGRAGIDTGRPLHYSSDAIPGGDVVTGEPGAQDRPFRVDEATIEELHAAIQAGRTTCVAVVQQYIERVRAYNGVASLLVTEDGAPVPEATGAVRATVPLRFPTETVKSSTVLLFLEMNQRPPRDTLFPYTTASDPDVQQ